jgi:L-glyceraldehyde 3-phosphate reductase
MHAFERYLAPGKVAETERKLKALAEVAKANNVSMATLATAWVIAYSDISCAIGGFTKRSYVDENMSALELLEKWTPELEKQISDILMNTPENYDFLKGTRRPH